MTTYPKASDLQRRLSSSLTANPARKAHSGGGAPSEAQIAALTRRLGGKAHVVTDIERARLVMGIKLVISLNERIPRMPTQTHSELAPRLVRVNG